MGRRASQPVWEVPLKTDIRPSKTIYGNDLGDGSFTRNSTVNYWGADGYMHEGAINEEVFECVGMKDGMPNYNGPNSQRACLCEPASTNSILFSRDVTNDAWTKSINATRDQTGIFGDVNSGVSCTDDSGTVAEYATQSITIVNDNNAHCASVYIKKDSDTSRFPEFRLDLVDGVDIKNRVQINTSTGLTAIREAGAGTSHSVYDYGDWWRLRLTTTNDTSGNVTARFRAYPSHGLTLGGSDNAATGTIVIDGIQVEFNTKIPSSFITTTSGAVTRATTSGYPRYTLPTNTFAESLGSELITDGGFDTACGAGNWFCDIPWTISGSSAYIDGSQAGGTTPDLKQDGIFSTADIGKLLKISFTVSNYNAGQFRIKPLGSANNGPDWIIGANQTFTFYTPITIRLNNSFYIEADANLDCNIDTLSIKQVTNAWDDKPPHGTAVIWWRPGFDLLGTTGDNWGILASDNAQASVLMLYWNGGEITSYDGTAHNINPYAYVAGNWYKIIAQWGYLVSNVAKFRAGVDSGSGISWVAASDFDGAFATGTYMHTGYNPYGPMHTKRLAIFDRILSDTEIDAMGSPSN